MQVVSAKTFANTPHPLGKRQKALTDACLTWWHTSSMHSEVDGRPDHQNNSQHLTFQRHRNRSTPGLGTDPPLSKYPTSQPADTMHRGRKNIEHLSELWSKSNTTHYLFDGLWGRRKSQRNIYMAQTHERRKLSLHIARNDCQQARDQNATPCLPKRGTSPAKHACAIAIAHQMKLNQSHVPTQ